ncbi:kinesin-like protein KIF20B [Fundulus diaphanus]
MAKAMAEVRVSESGRRSEELKRFCVVPEVNRLKEKVLQQNQGAGGPSEDLDLAKDEASRAQESLKILTEKSQAERRRWQEEKLSLIGQAKEAEDKRNQEMRKFAEDRERYCRQQSLLVRGAGDQELAQQPRGPTVTRLLLPPQESKLLEKEAAMESWRKERDALVAALEVQLQKLLSSQAEKDKVIKELSEQSSKQPAEVSVAPPLPSSYVLLSPDLRANTRIPHKRSEEDAPQSSLR